MRTRILQRIGWGLVFLMVVALVSVGPVAKPQIAGATSTHRVGVECTWSTSSPPVFSLETKTGYIVLPDGNTMFMWGYSLAGEAFQHPGPVLCVREGETVTVILQNNLPEDASIAFPGQDDVLADGVLAQPQFDAGGALTSLTTAVPPGGSVSYSFVANRPGSFLYESGTNPEKQVRMGMFGTLIVRPAMGDAFAYNRADSQFTPTEEFLVLLSEIDPYQHQAAENGTAFDLTTYKPRYWLINGRGFPDSMADNYASWLPSQPYGALSLIYPFNDTLPPDDINYHPYPGIIHYLSVGTENYPFHPHGNNGIVIGRDGYPLEGPAGEDLSFEKFAINVGPGQTWDVVFKWYDAEHYDEVTNPVPMTIPQVPNMAFGMLWSGSPYLGTMGPMAPGMSTLNECGEYYIISHNHALYQITAWGVTMSGPITYLRIDPPKPNTCP
ncbi:MAG: multicopper oxidase domain-containing protein [Anaerolineae bacterium]